MIFPTSQRPLKLFSYIQFTDVRRYEGGNILFLQIT